MVFILATLQERVGLGQERIEGLNNIPPVALVRTVNSREIFQTVTFNNTQSSKPSLETLFCKICLTKYEITGDFGRR